MTTNLFLQKDLFSNLFLFSSHIYKVAVTVLYREVPDFVRWHLQLTKKILSLKLPLNLLDFYSFPFAPAQWIYIFSLLYYYFTEL